jgi:hypothetical protein
MTDQIFVSLLDEGLDVWRPAPARQLDTDTFLILKPDDYDASVEHWQFPPGAVVECEATRTATGVILAAVRLKQDARRTA